MMDAVGAAAPASDRLGRPLTDLRISVTDRCNLRCRYCMPRSQFGPGHEFLPSAALLTPAQIELAARAFLLCGVRRIRLTGGEPLLRRELCDIVRRLARLDVDDVSLTTNGVLLGRLAHRLRRSGLSRITVSLDTLDPVTFERISDVHVPLQTVLDGIDAAERAGFGPIRLNCVLRRGSNESEVERLVAYARSRGHVLRFIEYMDVGASNGWTAGEVVPAAEVLRRAGADNALEPVEPGHKGEVARRYRFADGRGEVGVITSISAPFCRECCRIRLSADGRLFTCLFATRGQDIGGLLRSGARPERVADSVRAVWAAREDRYSELREQAPSRPARVEMSYIGG
jgi:cyclic pyranopterin phosphate synthase